MQHIGDQVELARLVPRSISLLFRSFILTPHLIQLRHRERIPTFAKLAARRAVRMIDSSGKLRGEVQEDLAVGCEVSALARQAYFSPKKLATK